MDFFIDIFLHIDQYLITFIQEYHEWTYPLLFSIVFCETGLVVLPFLPGDSLLFASGAVASLSEIPLELDWLMLTFSTAAMFGDSCNYLIGLYFGKKLFTKLNSKIFKQHYIEKTHYFFHKYGKKTIIIARFIPVIRTFTPFVAGMGNMNYHTFLIYDFIGTIIWVSLFCITGYFFGNIPFVQQNFEILVIGIVLISLCPAFIEYIRIKNKQTTI